MNEMVQLFSMNWYDFINNCMNCLCVLMFHSVETTVAVM